MLAQVKGFENKAVMRSMSCLRIFESKTEMLYIPSRVREL